MGTTLMRWVPTPPTARGSPPFHTPTLRVSKWTAPLPWPPPVLKGAWLAIAGFSSTTTLRQSAAATHQRHDDSRKALFWRASSFCVCACLFVCLFGCLRFCLFFCLCVSLCLFLCFVDCLFKLSCDKRSSMCAWGDASPLPTQPQEDCARVVVERLPPEVRVINAPQHLAPGRLVFDKPTQPSRIGRCPGRRRLQQASHTQTERSCTAS